MSEAILNVLQFAIDGVTTRQNAIANNLANAETPGFTATNVSFEQSLNDALSSTAPSQASITSAPSTDAPNAEGNNVNLAGELVDAEKATLQYQTLSESLNAQFRLLSGSAGGSYQ